MNSPFITDWVLAHAERTPDAPAVDGPQHRLTYAALATRIVDLAASLASAGVTSADRVLLAVPPSPVAAVASLAVQYLGACVVEIDRGMGRANLEKVIAQVRPAHAILAAQDARQWTEIVRENTFDVVWCIGALPRGGGPSLPARRVVPLLADGALAPADRGIVVGPVARHEEAPALVIYTSGSTGTPRGVIHTFRNIDANTRSIVEYLHLGPDERAMCILPFHYTYGKSLLQTHLHVGASLFIDPRFMYPRVVMDAIRTEACTSFAGVPATYEILRREVDVRAIPMPSLRYLTQAGGAMRAETVRWVRAAFAPARLFVMYGQTEATARLSYLPPDRGEEKIGSIGIPIPGVELRVVGDEGAPLPPGQAGHLVARGANVTPGYVASPGETAAILRGGWLWTGDLAQMDDEGFFWIVGRAKEMLKIGGHRVSATEIEAILLGHPAVKDAAVIGIDDPLQGEAAVAFVVLEREVADVETELRKLCRDRGGAYRTPTHIRRVDALPRNPSGKIMKAELAERIAMENKEGTA